MPHGSRLTVRGPVVDVVRHHGAEPPALEGLAAAADAEGHRFVQRTIDDWVVASNRFDAPGEVFFVAVGPTIIGAAGVNRDPFIDDPSVGRLRHVYVHPEVRRTGLGRRLVETCLDHATAHFDRLRLRTFDPDAASFYGACGFIRVDESDATHTLDLGRR